MARRGLTAASQPIDAGQKQFKAQMTAGSNRDGWQERAWDALDAVGELRYYVGWRSSSCSRCRLIASDIDPETGLPTGSTEDQRVADIVKAIAGGPLGQAQLVKRAVECLTVPGEVWVAILVRPEGEVWLALNRDEIKTTSGNKVMVELPTGDNHEVNFAADSMFRVWNPRPRRAKEADSPVRATLDPLDEITRTTRTISNASKSRLIGNGVVFVPNEMSLPSSQAPVAANKPGAVQAPLAGEAAVQQLQELLFQVAQTAYDDEDSMAALIPMFAGVPGDQVKNVSHVKFDNTVTEIAIKTRNDAIARLAMGLDVSPERLLGLGSTTNHWSAWAIGDEDVRLHIAPPMELLCQALYEQVVAKVLAREGIDPAAYMVWYDASALTADPDLTDEATNAFDRGAINAEAYRRYLGLGDDAGYDFTTMDGWKQWAQDRVSQKPELLPELLPLLDTVQSLDFAPPAAELPAASNEPAQRNDQQQEPATEGNSAPGGGNGGESASQVASVHGSEVEDAVVDLLVGRALELAGKRRRTRADYSRLRDVPMHETHRFMPPVPDAEVARLVAGWDAAVQDGSLAAAGLDGDKIRAAVMRAARLALTRPVVDVEA